MNQRYRTLHVVRLRTKEMIMSKMINLGKGEFGILLYLLMQKYSLTLPESAYVKNKEGFPIALKKSNWSLSKVYRVLWDKVVKDYPDIYVEGKPVTELSNDVTSRRGDNLNNYVFKFQAPNQNAIRHVQDKLGI